VGVKDGYLPSKKWLQGYFTDVGSCSVKTVADRHRHAAYHNNDKLLSGVNRDNLE